jgi:DNA replication protein DnaC
VYREAHTLIEEIADATLDGTRKTYLADLATVPLLIIDDLGMRKLPHTAAEDLLELVMRRYERASTLLTSNRLCGAPHNRFNAESFVMRTQAAVVVFVPGVS